ncbi:MAG: TonB family protein [Betaproteobacteria bacterium]|nr:TonB family protein [Betaproteobacteria bacterium]
MSSSFILQNGPMVGGAQRDDLKALALALVLELLLLGLAGAIYTAGMLRPVPAPKDLVTLQLSSLAPEPVPPASPPPRKVERPPLAQKIPVPPEPAPPSPEPLKTPVAQDTTPSPFAEKPVQPSPTPVSKPAEADILADYTAKIRAAVQTAVVFPRAAEELRFAGRTRVEFRLHQGRQGGARVIISSGINMFDRAALQAVQDAVYPQPPEALREQSRLFQIWVEFKQ